MSIKLLYLIQEMVVFASALSKEQLQQLQALPSLEISRRVADYNSKNQDEAQLSPAVAKNLTKLWTFPTGNIIAASPAIINGTVYVGSWDGYEYAIDEVTGKQKWKTFLGITQRTCGFAPGQTAGITST